MVKMSNNSTSSISLATATTLFFCAFSVPRGVVHGLSVPLASDPTNVRNQWDLDLQGSFGTVTIPGASLNSESYSRGRFFDNDDDGFSYSPLLPIDSDSAVPYSHHYADDHGYEYYTGAYAPSSFGSRRFPGSSLSMMASSPPTQVWKYNNLFVGGHKRNGWGNRRSHSRPLASPALSMANYMQNGGPGKGGNNRRRSGNYNNNNYDDYNDNYNDRNNRNNRNRDGYYGNNDRLRQQPSSRNNTPRGSNRFNTVGGLGSVNGANLSQDGRSLQFQNRRDSNTAGRSGRMMDDSFSQFAPDNNSRFESRPPNDNYARGGYRQDSRDGYWKDPNNYNVQNGPGYNSGGNNSYASSSVPSTGFRPIPPGDYVSAPAVRGPFNYEYGRNNVGGGNVPYDSAYYNNDYSSGNFNGYNTIDGDDEYYSRNGNVMDNRRRSGGRGEAPGGDQYYYNLDYRDSNRRMDRGGGLMNYRPNYNQRGGNEYDNQRGDEYYYDDPYDSSGSFYNHEGKRVRRFDPVYDRPDGYYNPDDITNDSTDPERMIQNQRRRDGRDVKSGAHLRRYNPEWDSNQGLYNEASLYGNDVKGTRQYSNGYGDDINNRVSPRRRPNTQDGSWGNRDQYSIRPNNGQYNDYRDDRFVEDGYDRGPNRFDNRQGNRDERYIDRRGDDYYDQYDEYDGNGRSRRDSPRRGLGRRDMDGERDYYRGDEYGGPNIRRDDSMERFRQGKDVKKNDPYGFETGNTPSSKKRIRTGRDPRMSNNSQRGNSRQRVGPMQRGREDPRTGRGSTVNGSYNGGSRNGRINGSGGRDRGLSLDDLNELL